MQRKRRRHGTTQGHIHRGQDDFFNDGFGALTAANTGDAVDFTGADFNLIENLIIHNP